MPLLIKFIKLIPLNLRTRIFIVLGYIFSLIPTRERKIAKLQMKLFLGKDFRNSLVSKVYTGFAQSAAEVFNINAIEALPGNVTCANEKLMQDILKKKKSLIILAAHTGNWDLLARYLIVNGAEITTAGKEARKPALQKVLVDIRNSYGIKTIWRSNKFAAKEIIYDLRNGRMVSALIDQDTEVASIFSNFFGVPVKTPSGFLELGKKIGCSFASVFAFRVSMGKYIVFFDEIDSSLSTVEIASEYHRNLEKYIRLYPEQWVWFHKRWRTLENGKTMSSAEYIKYLEEKIKHAGL